MQHGKGTASSLFRDRLEAGRQVAARLERRQLGDAVVVGLARGGVVVAAEVARCLELPLEALAVRKLAHPYRPEYGIGAVTAGHAGIYIRAPEEVGERELRRLVEEAEASVGALDRALHEGRERLDLRGRTAVLVDDGLATGATMVAAVRWARRQGSPHVVVAVPVGAAETAGDLLQEADQVVCVHQPRNFGAVGLWYDAFPQVADDEAIACLDALRVRPPAS